MVESRRPADHTSVRNIAWGSALCRNNNVIANVTVSGDAGLTSNDDVLAYDGRTRQADLSAQQGMLANS